MGETALILKKEQLVHNHMVLSQLVQMYAIQLPMVLDFFFQPGSDLSRRQKRRKLALSIHPFFNHPQFHLICIEKIFMSISLSRNRV